MRRPLIIKDSQTAITIHNEYIELKHPKQNSIIAFCHIESIYLNKAIDVSIGECYKIMQKVPFFLIDENGYILAQFVEVQ